MIENYNTEVDEESMIEITSILLKVRNQYMAAAKESQILFSEEYNRLLKFDEEQKAKQPEYKNLYQNMKKENDCGDNCSKKCCQQADSSDESDESDEEKAPK